jgi:hypothetical protein
MALAADSLHAKSLSHEGVLLPGTLVPSFPRSLPFVHWGYASSSSTRRDRHGRHSAACPFTNHE